MPLLELARNLDFSSSLCDSSFHPSSLCVVEKWREKAWSLWERYSQDLCDNLPVKCARRKDDSHVDWVRVSMDANNFCFADCAWFSSANCLRNLLAHFGGRAVESRARKLLERSHTAFPDLETYSDGYAAIDHCHVADLELRIQQFIEDTAQQSESTVPVKAAPRASSSVR